MRLIDRDEGLQGTGQTEGQVSFVISHTVEDVIESSAIRNRNYSLSSSFMWISPVNL